MAAGQRASIISLSEGAKGPLAKTDVFSSNAGMETDLLIKYGLGPLGIGLVLLVSWALGAWRQGRLVSPEAAHARFEVDFPGCQVEDIALSRDGRSAVLTLNSGMIGLVFAVGDRFVTRRWQPGVDWRLTRRNNRLTLGPHDGTMRAPSIIFRGPDEASLWLSRLTRLLGQRATI